MEEEEKNGRGAAGQEAAASPSLGSSVGGD